MCITSAAWPTEPEPLYRSPEEDTFDGMLRPDAALPIAIENHQTAQVFIDVGVELDDY